MQRISRFLFFEQGFDDIILADFLLGLLSTQLNPFKSLLDPFLVASKSAFKRKRLDQRRVIVLPEKVRIFENIICNEEKRGQVYMLERQEILNKKFELEHIPIEDWAEKTLRRSFKTMTFVVEHSAGLKEMQRKIEEEGNDGDSSSDALVYFR